MVSQVLKLIYRYANNTTETKNSIAKGKSKGTSYHDMLNIINE